MKKTQQIALNKLTSETNGFSFTDSCFVRTAGLPFDTLDAWSETFPSPDNVSFDPLNDRSVLFDQQDDFLQKVFASVEGKLALRLASPTLFQEFQSFQNDDGLSAKKKLAKMNKVLTKYFVRWCSRATPFGLFSNVAVLEKVRKSSLPDLEYFLQMDQGLVEGLWKEVGSLSKKLFVNPSLHDVGLRSYFFFHDPNSGINSLRSIDNLDRSLLSKSGELAAVITSADSKIIETAYEDGILLDTKIPKAIGISPLNQLVNLNSPKAVTSRLEDFTNYERQYNNLEELHNGVIQLETLAKGIDRDTQKPVANVTVVGCPTSFDGLSEARQQIESNLSTLLGLLWHPPTNEADEIHQIIVKKYGREPIPLLEFASQELWPRRYMNSQFDLEKPNRLGNEFESNDLSNKRGLGFESWAFKVLSDWPMEKEMCLDRTSIQSLPFYRKTQHDNQSGYALASSVEVEGRPRVHFKYIVGPTALSMLGRFANGSSTIKDFASQIADIEQKQSKGIICDVSFLPSFKGVNVISRPVLRDFEITLDRPPNGANAPQSLDLQQLYLASVNGKLRLFSSEFNQVIHPRISCAYNHRLINDTLFRILAAVQSHEDSLSRIWHWGQQSWRPRLPRISFENIILRPASWRIQLRKKERMSLKKSDGMEQVKFVTQLRKNRNLPKRVSTGQLDQQLLYDLDNPKCCLLLAEELVKKESLKLDEVFHPNGKYTNEIVLPFFTNKTSQGPSNKTENPSKTPLILTTTADRKKWSSQWLSFELYTHFSEFNHLLEICWKNFQYLQDKGLAKKWFFIRYNDTKPHLRYRIEIDPKQSPNAMELCLSHTYKILQDLVLDGKIDEVKMVTYAPEFQRYGGSDLLHLTHDFFWQDSEMLAAILPSLSKNHLEDQCASLSCLFIDRIFHQLDLPLEQRRALVQLISDSLSKEFPGLKPKYWGQDYHKHRTTLIPLLSGDARNSLIPEVSLFVRIAGLGIGSIGHDYLKLVLTRYGNAKWQEVLSSLLHMHVNRVFTENWRFHELRVMKLLTRCYAELWHKSKS